jgi:hypothetical protein
MVQTFSSGVNSHLNGEEILGLLWNQTVGCRVQKSPPLAPFKADEFCPYPHILFM